MNQNFLEDRSNEKINDLISEGLISQEFYRSGAKKLSLFRHLPRVFLGVIGLLIILGFLIR